MASASAPSLAASSSVPVCVDQIPESSRAGHGAGKLTIERDLVGIRDVHASEDTVVDARACGGTSDRDFSDAVDITEPDTGIPGAAAAAHRARENNEIALVDKGSLVGVEDRPVGARRGIAADADEVEEEPALGLFDRD